MRVLPVDPSNMTGGDPLGCVLLESIVPDINILGAKFWNNADFTKVESEIADIFHKKKADLLVIESNSMGHRIAHSFIHEYNLPVKQVYTSNKLKDPKPGTMDKMEHANWLIKMQQEGHLNWAKAESEYMKELQRQWNIFGEYKKGKLAAPPGEHDDLLMPLMIGTFVIRQMEFSGTLKFWNIDDIKEPESDIVSILNKEVTEGKTGLSWIQT